MKNVHEVALVSVKHATRRFDDLAVNPPLEFGWFRTAIRMSFELLNVIEYSAYEFLRCFGIV